MMDFGELRSRLAGEQGSKGRSLVRAWADQAWEAERFEALAGLKRLALGCNGALDTRILDKSPHLPTHLKTQYTKSYLT